MLKKIKSIWGRKDDWFLVRSEDGRHMFYPWGRPGEAFVFDSRLKNAFILVPNGLLWALSFFIIFPCFLHHWGKISVVEMDALVGCLVSIFFILYFSFMFLARKKVELFVLEQKVRPIKIFLFPLPFVLVQLNAIVSLYEAGYMSNWGMILLFLFLCANTVLVAGIYCFLIITRGYFFEKISQ